MTLDELEKEIAECEKTKLPAARLLEDEKQINETLRMYHRMFGTCMHGIYHEHHHTVTYLQGRLDGIRHAMRVMDL